MSRTPSSEIRDAFIVSPSEADNLLEEWREENSGSEVFPDPVDDEFQKLSGEDFAYSSESQVIAPRNGDSADGKSLRAKRDYERRQKRREYLLRWSLEQRGCPTLFLNAERRYEVEKLQEFEEGRAKIRHTDEHLQRWKSTLQVEPGRYRIGCIYEKSDGWFVWRLFEGSCSEGEAACYNEALELFVKNLQGLRFCDNRRFVTSFESLEESAPQEW